MALTAAQVSRILSYRGKIKYTKNPVPLTEEEQDQMILALDRTVLFPRR